MARSSSYRQHGSQKKSKAFRVVAGRHACEEVLKVRPETVCEAWVDQLGSPFGKQLQNYGIKNRLQKSSREMEAHCFSHQGCILFVSETPRWEGSFPKGPGIWVGVDGVSDPHNLGALLRSCWLLGVQGVFVREARSAALTPAAHKVASGALEHVPVEYVSSMEAMIKRFQKEDFWAFALEAQGEAQIHQVNYPERLLWIVGSEDKGVRPSVRKACDESLSISQVDASASYNMSVALSMALYESRRAALLKN